MKKRRAGMLIPLGLRETPTGRMKAEGAAAGRAVRMIRASLCSISLSQVFIVLSLIRALNRRPAALERRHGLFRARSSLRFAFGNSPLGSRSVRFPPVG